jgi:hypothetical protein
MNWLDIMTRGVLRELVYDAAPEVKAGSFTKELAYFMTRTARLRRTRLLAYYVPADLQTPADEWFAFVPGENYVKLVGSKIFGCEVRARPDYLTRLYLDSGYQLPVGKIELVVGLCEDGQIVLGAY